MKIAISANEPKLISKLDPRFGRCEYFVVIDSETREWEAFPNPAMEEMGGAGTQAAQFLADNNVEAVISGDFGPNAFTALEAGGIRMYKSSVDSIPALLKKLVAGRLDQVSSPTRSKGRRGAGRRMVRDR
jgi:predicted Fe-Mo cluster-binding NifX family protein